MDAISANPRPKAPKSLTSLVLLIAAHSLLISFGALLAVFYLRPHDVYFATPAYIAAGLGFAFVNYFEPIRARFMPIRDAYFTRLIFYPRSSWAFTIFVAGISTIWTATMWETLRNRIVYQKHMSEAMSALGIDGYALPSPTALAKAFNAAPDRPEVPFVLTRASRLLAPDAQTEIFSKYLKVFFDAVDKKSLSLTSKIRPRYQVSIGNETTLLPHPDPIHFITRVAFETNIKGDQEWAIATLQALRHDDKGAELQLAVWRNHLSSGTGENSAVSAGAYVAELERIISPPSGADISTVAFVTDHIYQVGLDQLATALIELEAANATSTERCINVDRIAQHYERILVLRRRLAAQQDIVWWQPPGKIFLYYLFLHLGGQTINIGQDVLEKIRSCPTLADRLKAIYEAPAFRAFQNPEEWSKGTPLASSFNGAAGVTRVKEWLKLGW